MPTNCAIPSSAINCFFVLPWDADCTNLMMEEWLWLQKYLDSRKIQIITMLPMIRQTCQHPPSVLREFPLLTEKPSGIDPEDDRLTNAESWWSFQDNVIISFSCTLWSAVPSQQLIGQQAFNLKLPKNSWVFSNTQFYQFSSYSISWKSIAQSKTWSIRKK